MPRPLSSSAQTWIARFAFIPAAIGAAIVFTQVPRQLLWFLVPLFFVAIYLCVRNFRLKTVELDGNDLLISYFSQQIRVPLSTVSEVRGGRGGKSPIKIIFRTDTDFGQSIEFLPPHVYSMMWPWTPHPLVMELRELVQASLTGKSR